MPSKKPWWRKKPEEWRLNPTDLLLLLELRTKESKESKKSDAKRRSEDLRSSQSREDAKSRLWSKERDKEWSLSNREELRSSAKELNKRRFFLSKSLRHKLSCPTVFSKWKLPFHNLPQLLQLKSIKLELCNIIMSNRWECKLMELEHSRRSLTRRSLLLLLNTRLRRHNTTKECLLSTSTLTRLRLESILTWRTFCILAGADGVGCNAVDPSRKLFAAFARFLRCLLRGFFAVISQLLRGCGERHATPCLHRVVWWRRTST